MARLFTFIFLVLFCLEANSQDGFKRQYKIPMAYNNSAKAFFETNSGSYLLCGLVVDTINNNLTNRLSILGLNNQGQVQWAKKYGNKKFEYLDNQFISKWFFKQGDYIYYTGCVRDSNNVQLGVFMKFNLNGDTVWQRRFYDSAFDVIPQGVSSSIDGGFLITGFFQDITSRQCLIIKTDLNGNELWRKKIPKAIPNVQDGKQILQDSVTKKIVIVGYQYIGNASSWSNSDNILICDSLGNKLSQNTLSGQTGGLLVDLVQTKDKKIVAVGTTIYPQTLGGSNMTKSYALKFDINSPSSFIWRINDFDTLSLNNFFTGIIEKPNGDFILGGIIEREHKKNLPDNCLNRITWITPNGIIKNNRTYQYSDNTNNDYLQLAQTITQGSNGSILAALQLYNTSPNPFFVVRYDSTGCDSSTLYCQTLGLEDYKSISVTVNLYPNPTKSTLYLKSQITIYNAEILIYDAYGKKIIEKKIDCIEANTEMETDLNNLDRGIYFMRIFSKGVLVKTGEIVRE